MYREQIIEKLRELKPMLAEKYHICNVGLFGSYARDDANENSDIDLLVDYDQVTPLWDVVETIDDLEQVFKRKVEVTHRKYLKKYIKEYVMREVIFV